MPRLFSYCIPVDDGAAPNPYWGICTLAICKPAIRRKAMKGDWIVGTGSKRSLGDISGQVVYAMKVSEVVSMEEYDRWTRRTSSKKIPDAYNCDSRRKLGDSIYDYSAGQPRLRKSVHDKKNRKTDLSGKNVLISNHFFYFGDKPRRLPFHLQPIAQQIRGHRVHKNDAYVEPFIKWLRSLNLKPNCLYGKPAIQIDQANCETRAQCANLDSTCQSKLC